MTLVVFYSSASGNTKRFINKLGIPALQLAKDEQLQPTEVDAPFILICPTYADGSGRGAVPKSVIHFLNRAKNRQLMLGVIGSGNRNFGDLFASAGDVIAEKCGVPLLYRFELAGTLNDVQNVQNGLIRIGRKNNESRNN